MFDGHSIRTNVRLKLPLRCMLGPGHQQHRLDDPRFTTGVLHANKPPVQEARSFRLSALFFV